jgi:hypothetical protein
MAGELSFGAGDWFNLQDTFGAAQTLGADQSYVTPRTSDTVTGDAVNGSAAIDNDSGGSWTGFWQDTLKAVVGYSIAKDAQRNAVVTPAAVPGPAPGQAAVAQAPATPRWLLPALIVAGAGLVYVAVKKG